MRHFFGIYILSRTMNKYEKGNLGRGVLSMEKESGTININKMMLYKTFCIMLSFKLIKLQVLFVSFPYIIRWI